MREIKFRGWDGEKMIESFCHIGKNGKVYTIHHNEIEPDYNVMQYTGLHDKNGKEIFEGDIVEAPQMTHRSTVGYNLGSFSAWGSELNKYIDNYRCQLFEKIEIIGNIYQNKELLK